MAPNAAAKPKRRYNSKWKANVQADPLLDHVIAGRVDRVPAQCASFQGSHPADAPVILVGTVKPAAGGQPFTKISTEDRPKVQEEPGIFGCPNKGTLFKYHEMWTDKDGYLHSPQIGAAAVNFLRPLLNPDLFEMQYAKVKFTETQKVPGRYDWYFSIWKDRTGQTAIPAPGVSTYGAQNTAVKAGSSNSKSTGGSRSKKAKRAERVISPAEEEEKEMWNAWVRGVLKEIDDEGVQEQIVEAYLKYHKAKRGPPKELVLEAYGERLEKNLPSTLSTQVWRQWEEEHAKTGRQITVISGPLFPDIPDTESQFSHSALLAREYTTSLVKFESAQEASEFTMKWYAADSEFQENNRGIFLSARIMLRHSYYKSYPAYQR